jgi:hypothetical protein
MYVINAFDISVMEYMLSKPLTEKDLIDKLKFGAGCGLQFSGWTCISDVEINYYSSTMRHFVPPCCFYCGDLIEDARY